MVKQSTITITKIDYPQIQEAVDRVSPLLSDYDAIVGIVRGGLVPATMLAHKLNKRALAFIQLSSYNADNKQDILIETVHLNVSSILNKRVIFVDDICDTGKTLEYVRTNYGRYVKSAFYFTFAYKHNLLFEPDYYHLQVDHDIWLKFPWEQ